MKTNIKATHIEFTPALEAYLAKRIAGLDKFILPADGGAFAQIELAKTSEHHKTGDVFRAEINLRAGGKDFYVFAERADIQSAIDAMRDEILNQLRSSKDKRVSFVRRGGRRMKNFLRGIIRRKDDESL